MSGMFGSVAIWSQGNGLSKSELGGRWESLVPVCTLQRPSCPLSKRHLASRITAGNRLLLLFASSRARNYLGQLTSLCLPGCQSSVAQGPRHFRLVLGSKRKPGFLSAGSPAPQVPPSCRKMGLLGKTGALAESTRRNLPSVSCMWSWWCSRLEPPPAMVQK